MTRPKSESKQTQRARRAARRAKARETGKCQGFFKSGKPCTLKPVPGRATCARFHGGSGGGQLTAGGRYAEVKGQLGEAYRASLADPKLTDLTELIAVLDGLVKVHMARMDQGDSPAWRSQLLGMVEEMKLARGQPGGQAGEVFKRLVSHIEQGASQIVAEDQLAAKIERVARRIESKISIEMAAKNVMPAKEIVKVISMILEIMTRLAPKEIADAMIREMDARVIPSLDANPSLARN